MQLRAMWPISPHWDIVLANEAHEVVLDITHLVALGGLAVAARGGALARKVTGLAALVAGLVLLHGLRAITAWSWLVHLEKRHKTEDILM